MNKHRRLSFQSIQVPIKHSFFLQNHTVSGKRQLSLQGKFYFTAVPLLLTCNMVIQNKQKFILCF